MTAVCCAGRCLGCCASRRALVRRAQCRAVLPLLLVLLGAGWAAAWAGSWSGWVFLGAVLGGALQDVLGRRAVVALSAPLQVSACLLQGLLVDDEEGFSYSRLTRSACAGVGLGMALPCSLVYLAELWRPARRGAVCCVPTVAVVLGRGLAFALEHRSVLEPRAVALVGVAPSLLGLVLLLLLAPPSPFWLALRGRDVSLRRALARVRGLRDERGVRDEADDVVDAVREQRSGVCAGNLRGPVLAVLLLGTLPLAGVELTEGHFPRLLRPVGVDLSADGDEAWLTRVACSAGVAVALILVTALVDVCGRRPLAVAACLALSAGYSTLGYFYWFLGLPLPARALLAHYITLGAGCLVAVGAAALTALAWVVVAEVLPMRGKPWLPALAVLVYAACRTAIDVAVLAVPHLVPDAAEGAGRYLAASWCYGHALWALLIAAIVAGLLPETKGFTLAQLHEILRGPNRQTVQTRL